MTMFGFARLLLSVITITVTYAACPEDGDMTLISLPPSTSPGGKCMNGSMAGYYFRNGTPDSNVYVIDLAGGGGCYAYEDCLGRLNSKLGNSDKFCLSYEGKIRFLSSNCDDNPDFCQATAVHVPYCTSDGHRGNNTEPFFYPENDEVEFYFDGHANFAAIVERLIEENGMGNAGNKVILTGGSAGGNGVMYNVDWLMRRLGPEVTVKGAPLAGWSPGALPEDLPAPFPPTDYDNFLIGESGNQLYDMVMNGEELVDIHQMSDILPKECLDKYQWWACATIHNVYRYSEAPLYIVHQQYDQNQIFSQNDIPEPRTAADQEDINRYVDFWGTATRASLQMILDDDLENPKSSPDGVFSASCKAHIAPKGLTINGLRWQELIHDWFFEIGALSSDYRLVERCHEKTNGGDDKLEVPCNEHPSCPVRSNCACLLREFGCLAEPNKKKCQQCAQSNENEIVKGKCKDIDAVKEICKNGGKGMCEDDEDDDDETCQDDPNWLHTTNSGKNKDCSWFAGMKNNKRKRMCKKKKGTDGEKGKDACPVSCKTCPK